MIRGEVLNRPPETDPGLAAGISLLPSANPIRKYSNPNTNIFQNQISGNLVWQIWAKALGMRRIRGSPDYNRGSPDCPGDPSKPCVSLARDALLQK